LPRPFRKTVGRNSDWWWDDLEAKW
jgi:hypothetical protein